MSIRRALVATIAAGAFGLGGAAFAQHGGHGQGGATAAEKASKQEKVTIEGRVVDLACFTRMGASGEKHLKCAEYCAGLGLPIGLLDGKTGELYLVLPEGHASVTEKMTPFLEKHVRVTGTLWHKGGLKSIEVKSIEKKG